MVVILEMVNIVTMKTPSDVVVSVLIGMMSSWTSPMWAEPLTQLQGFLDENDDGDSTDDNDDDDSSRLKLLLLWISPHKVTWFDRPVGLFAN